MIYQRLPSLGELNAARQRLIEYYEEHGPPPGPMDADTDFEDNFRWRIIEAADRNTASNNAKQSCLHTGIVWLFVMLAATTVLAVPYAVDQVMARSKAPATYIDNV